MIERTITRTVTYEIPDIDPEVAELCQALGEEIVVKIRWQPTGKSSSNTGFWALRVESDIYGLEVDEKHSIRERMAIEAYQKSECDNEMRYDSEYNWWQFDSKDEAEEVVKMWVRKQLELYRGCVFHEDYF